MAKSKGCGCLPLLILLGGAGYGGYYLYEQYLHNDSSIENSSSVNEQIGQEQIHHSDIAKETQKSAEPTEQNEVNKTEESETENLRQAQEEARLREQEAARKAQEEEIRKAQEEEIRKAQEEIHRAQEEARIAKEEARKAQEEARLAQEEARKAKEEQEKQAQLDASTDNEQSPEQQQPEEHGLSASQIRELGVDYAEARNGKQTDEQRAIQLYIKAAEMGDIKAQRWMGWRYRQGRGVPMDEQMAYSYFLAAANQGDKAAAEAINLNVSSTTYDDVSGLTAAQIRELGVDYAEARNGKRQDEQRAIQLYIKAAEMGDIKAQRWMGWRYRQGRGVQKNEQRARSYFSAAARQGDQAAAEALKQ